MPSWRVIIQDTPYFRSGKPLLSDFGSTAAEKHPKDPEFLDKYASERWDVSGFIFSSSSFQTILHYMVGSTTDEVSAVVKEVLLQSELMKSQVDMLRLIPYLIGVALTNLLVFLKLAFSSFLWIDQLKLCGSFYIISTF